MAVLLEQEVVVKEVSRNFCEGRDLITMKNKILYLFIFLSGISFSQSSITELLKKYNSESIPYITVQELALPKTDVILLDAREFSEFEVSHIKDGIYVGYDDFDISKVTKKITDKDAKIVVYCSIGVRSEDIGEQLKEAGYLNVSNLFGGIFEWKNKDNLVYNSKNEVTENVHTFSKKWSQWLLNGIKIYD